MISIVHLTLPIMLMDVMSRQFSPQLDPATAGGPSLVDAEGCVQLSDQIKNEIQSKRMWRFFALLANRVLSHILTGPFPEVQVQSTEYL